MAGRAGAVGPLRLGGAGLRARAPCGVFCLVFGFACGAAGVPGVGGLFCVRYRSGSPATSHVIPLQVFQTLNLERWNCNVFGRSRKMTEGNYVRLLFGGTPFIEALPGLPVPFMPVLPGVSVCLWCLLSGVLPCLWCCWCSGRRRPLLCEVPEWFPSNVARNSPASISNIEFRTLELQRFRAVSKNDRGKLRATFVVIQRWGELLP